MSKIPNKILLTTVFIVFCTFASFSHAAEKHKPLFDSAQPKILLTIPSPDNFSFWLRVKQFAQVVSDSLGAQLQVYTFKPDERNRFVYSSVLEKIIESDSKPDFIIGMFWMHGESKLLETIESHQIPLISFNSSLSQQQFKTIGSPGEKYKYWLAHISPDDRATGAAQAHLLAANLPINIPANMLAIAGDQTSTPGINRVQGLHNNIKLEKRINLLQLVHTDWSSYTAKMKMEHLLKRFDHDRVKLLWTAGDYIALGAIEAIEQHGLQAGKDILVSGIDWNKESFALIKSGKMTLSLGGHFIEAGKAIILAYDHLHGIDFTENFGIDIKTTMNIMNQKNVEYIESKLTQAHWQTLDFKHLSKKHNPQLKRYHLTLNDLLQLEQ
ncbi:MAG: ABC-type sugar transport system substrate-binding protein [Phenylobacterium sp.]|jgi:ABC-type sugar transport system substrate-binding protein